MSLVSSAGLAARRELPRGLWVALAIAALAAVGVLALAIGPVAIPLGEIPQLIWSRFDADLAAGLDPIRRAVLLDIRLPRLVLALLEKVEGLKLTLDYAHFACLGYRQEEIDPLAPHAAHVHLRQARPGALQTKLAEGTLNMAAQFATLRDAGFHGHLALEYVHQDYMNTLHDDVLTETIGLRDQFRAWCRP